MHRGVFLQQKIDQLQRMAIGKYMKHDQRGVFHQQKGEIFISFSQTQKIDKVQRKCLISAVPDQSIPENHTPQHR